MAQLSKKDLRCVPLHFHSVSAPGASLYLLVPWPTPNAQFFYSLLSQIHSFHKASGLSHDGRQTDKYKIRILFLITVHKITRLSLPFTLLSRLFIYVYSNKRRITKDMHLPNTSNYDYISTSRTMPTLVKVSFYSRASLCDELSMEMMLSD